MHNTPELWLSQLPFPRPAGHKYDRGHALIYGGEIMTGAARLAARAAQRIGAGLVTIATTAKALPIYATALESIMVREANDVSVWQKLLTDTKINSVLIGPGLGQGDTQKQLVLAALESRKPCVLDADALTNFATEPETLFAKLHNQCVLTPHEGEFAKLFGSKIDGAAAKQTRALEAAKLANSVIVLKGADTLIATPDGQAIHNDNAPPWLATAGAGDVLAGIILGLITQQMPTALAAAAGVWIHGRIATNFGIGLIAEDIVDGIPAVLTKLRQQP